MQVEYNVTIKRSALKNLELLPEKVKEINMSPVGSTTKKASSSRSTMLGRTHQENTQPTARRARGLGSFRFKKGTPISVKADFLSRYGRWIHPGSGLGAKLVAPVDPDSSIEYIMTDFHKKVAARLTPGKSLKYLREANGLSQSELGALVGDKKPVAASRVSDWESDFRAISKPVAKKLAAIFHVSVDRFI